MKTIKLFEEFIINDIEQDADDVYRLSLNDDYWKEVSKKFPNYNSPKSDDCDKAVDFILNGIKEKYWDYDWKRIEDIVKDKIKSGLT